MISKDRQTAVIIIVIINIMQQVLCRVPLQVSKSQKSMGPNVGRYQWVVVQQVVEKWCIERLCLGNLKKKLKKKKSAEITVWLQPGRIMNELAIFVNKSDFGIWLRRSQTSSYFGIHLCWSQRSTLWESALEEPDILAVNGPIPQN